MAIPQVYEAGAEAAFASYDYIDIAEGTGIIILNGMAVQDDSGVDHILSRNTLYSHPKETTAATTTSSTFAEALSLNFDLSPFNLPRTLEGTAWFSLSWKIAFATSNQQAYFIVRLKKGAVEIGSVQTQTGATASAGVDEGWLSLVTIPVTTAVHFKKGDVLRVTIEGWARNPSNANASVISLAHDPKDRDTGYGDESIHSTLQMGIPFRIDI